MAVSPLRGALRVGSEAVHPPTITNSSHQLVWGHPRLPDEARKRLEARRERDAVFPGQTFLDLGYPKTAFLK